MEVEAAAVEVDGGLEVLLVTEAAGHAFDRHDLAVEALGHRVGKLVLTVRKDVGQVSRGAQKPPVMGAAKAAI